MVSLKLNSDDKLPCHLLTSSGTANGSRQYGQVNESIAMTPVELFVL